MLIWLIKYISSICAIPLHGDRLFSSVPCWKRVLDAGRQECFLIGSKCSCILVATVPKNKQMNYSSMAAAFALWSRKWNLWNLSLLNSSRGGLDAWCLKSRILCDETNYQVFTLSEKTPSLTCLILLLCDVSMKVCMPFLALWGHLGYKNNGRMGC